MTKEKAATFHCTFEATLSMIAGKYKALAIWHLGRNGVLRFSELQRKLPRATPKMLSQQLKEMIEDGLVGRQLYPVIPPKVEYRLTPLGQTLVPLLNAMCDWGYGYFRQMGIPAPGIGAKNICETRAGREEG